MLQDFEEYYQANADKYKNARFKIRAFNNGVTAIKRLEKDKTPIPKELKELIALRGIGKGIAERIMELQKTNKVEEWEKIKKDPVVKSLAELASILGFGPAMARKLYDLGIKNISDLKANLKNIQTKQKLTSTQLIGIKYHAQLKKRIPREEVSKLKTYLNKQLKVTDKNAKITITGSYRRGKKDCGDVDVLLIDPDIKTAAQAKKSDLLKQFVNNLLSIEKERISIGKTKYMGLFNWPINTNKIVHVDIRFVPQESYIAALSYFTGSKENNLEMRRKAISLGYKLNEYGLYKSGQSKPIPLESEKDLYKKLEMKYKGPKSR